MAESRFTLIGNHPCVDFVNTEQMDAGKRVDLLTEFRDLAAWLTAARLIDPAAAAAAVRRWADRRAGERALRTARNLRARVRGMLEHIVRGQPIPRSTVETINAMLVRHVGHTELARRRAAFVRRFRFVPRDAGDLVVPVAEAAADFLCRVDFSRVRKCENPPCLRYFYDVSKNGGRRWCSMSVCGNRAKVAAYRRRARHCHSGGSRPVLSSRRHP